MYGIGDGQELARIAAGTRFNVGDGALRNAGQFSDSLLRKAEPLAGEAKSFCNGVHACDWSAALHHVGVGCTITFVIEQATPLSALDRAIKHRGTVAAFASELGVSASLPSMWKKRGQVPAEHCPAIERATGGAVRCEELRPDVAWEVLRQSPTQPTGAAHAA